MKKPTGKMRIPTPPPNRVMKAATDYNRKEAKAVDMEDTIKETPAKLASILPLEEIEWEAKKQMYDVLSIPSLIKLALMPDVHAGYDLPIGGVALLDGYISPSFVGYDIGCGMCHLDTEISASEFTTERLEEIYAAIVKKVPTGFSSLPESSYRNFYDKYNTTSVLPSAVRSRVYDKSISQLGTLGGGNHFIELGSNNKGNLCITLHSGSRNVGHSIGAWYMKQGRMFPLTSELGQSYLYDLEFTLQWALDNRKEMLKQVLSVIGLEYKANKLFSHMINENHNHATVTKEGVLHRKGATPAEEGQLGIIPANMRDGVYITRGLGNTEFLCSASHGCGRVMGRNVAKKTLDYDKFVKSMEGIVCSTDRSILDEAPDAYKDANYVISAQEGVVVNVIDYIKPLLNIKAAE